MHFVESVSVVNKVAFGWLASASMLSVLKQFHIVSSKNWKSTCKTRGQLGMCEDDVDETYHEVVVFWVFFSLQRNRASEENAVEHVSNLLQIAVHNQV